MSDAAAPDGEANANDDPLSQLNQIIMESAQKKFINSSTTKALLQTIQNMKSTKKKLFPSPIDNEDGNETDEEETKLDSFTSPKMSKLIRSTTIQDKEGGFTLHSFYGSLCFADDQDVFNQVFGTKPQLLKLITTQSAQSSETAVSHVDELILHTKLQQYIEKCEFELFCHIVEEDYVGKFDPDSSQKATNEIVKKIKSLRQTFKPNNAATPITLHPAALYNKYLDYIPSLPNIASSWGMSLPQTFFDALSSELQEKMEEDNFILPDLTNLPTSQLQLKALREVKETATTSYENLLKEKKRLQNLLGAKHSTQTAKRHLLISTDDNQEDPNPNPVFLQQSQAENTLSRYMPPTADANKGFLQLDHRLGLKDGANGLRFPYRLDDPTTISDFPYGFRGCLGCGSNTHWNFKRDCPHNQNREVIKKFWKNLWIQKPDTKKLPSSPANNSVRFVETSSPVNHVVPLPPAPSNNIGRGLSTTTPAWMNSSSPSTPTGLGIGDTSSVVTTGSSLTTVSDYNAESRSSTPKPILKKSKHTTTPNFLVEGINLQLQATKPMPLPLDNLLPSIIMSFANKQGEEITSFRVLADSCAGMNTGNLRTHMIIMSLFPDIVESFQIFDNPDNLFDPLKLHCAVNNNDNSETNYDDCLTATVTYRTTYQLPDGKPYLITFGLGANIDVNAIIGNPTLRKEWNADILNSSNSLRAQNIQTEFDLSYEDVKKPSSFMPNWQYNEFICPTQSSLNSPSLKKLLDSKPIKCPQFITTESQAFSDEIHSTEPTNNTVTSQSATSNKEVTVMPFGPTISPKEFVTAITDTSN